MGIVNRKRHSAYGYTVDVRKCKQVETKIFRPKPCLSDKVTMAEGLGTSPFVFEKENLGQTPTRTDAPGKAPGSVRTL